MKLTPEDIAYLQQSAQTYGYTPQDVSNMQRVINYESSSDPSRWGGKGGRYFGLIQFGPNERQQFHVDTEHPNARNQIDAMWQFMKARGYKPGMGLLNAYSTVNAGSPGHFNASDGNGTVSSHVARMLGQPVSGPAVPTPPLRPMGLMSMGVTQSGQAEAPAPDTSLSPKPPEEDLSGLLKPPAQASNPLAPILSAIQQQAPQDDVVDQQGQAMLQQMQDYHKQMHALAVKGLI
jgi:hypothetical protein